MRLAQIKDSCGFLRERYAVLGFCKILKISSLNECLLFYCEGLRPVIFLLFTSTDIHILLYR